MEAQDAVTTVPLIDEELCTGCGQCVTVCPDQTLTLHDKVAQVVSEKCMACGHCLAACPVGAMRHAKINEALGLTTVEERSGWLAPGAVDAAGLIQLLRSRRSVRHYQDRPVAREILEDLVKVGTTAPSGTNSQAWTFTILDRREQVERLGGLTAAFFQRLNRKAASPLWRLAARLFAGDSLGRYYRRHFQTVEEGLADWHERGLDRLFHGAPAAILVGGKREASCPGEDALLATSHILLAAHAMGLSSCLIGFVVEAMRHDHTIAQALAIPGGEEVYAVVALGYGKELYQRSAGRKRAVVRFLDE